MGTCVWRINKFMSGSVHFSGWRSSNTRSSTGDQHASSSMSNPQVFISNGDVVAAAWPSFGKEVAGQSSLNLVHFCTICIIIMALYGGVHRHLGFCVEHGKISSIPVGIHHPQHNISPACQPFLSTADCMLAIGRAADRMLPHYLCRLPPLICLCGLTHSHGAACDMKVDAWPQIVVFPNSPKTVDAEEAPVLRIYNCILASKRHGGISSLHVQ